MQGKGLCTWLMLLTLLTIAVAVVYAQSTPCLNPPFNPPWGQELPLNSPPSIVPGQNGEINTSLVIRKRDSCVPVWNASANPKTWEWQQFSLRTYGFPKDPNKPINPDDPNDPNLQWGFPGPTLRARMMTLKDPTQKPGAANPVQTPGTRVKLTLYSRLPNNSFPYDQCEDAYYCDTASGQQACQLQGNKWTCPGDPSKVCQEPPEGHHACFHGADVTNLHYHGTHVSPQPPQDFVLLQLFSKEQTNPPPPDPNLPENKFNTAIGQYQTNIDPFPWNQAPGTHWYHPHKHGSTGLQVLNGMAGALLIAGPFDDWLNGVYDGKLVDRVLVIQQIRDQQKFFQKDIPNYPPQVLINGYATPKILMKAGEIQRWRFIGATMQASASLEIGFDERIQEVRQIAQDGVQFAWQNYERQPYRDTESTYKNFQLSPGGRADFLVKAPDTPGLYVVSHTVFARNLAETVQAVRRTDVRAEQRVPPQAVPVQGPPVDTNGNPLLFTIEVTAEKQPMNFPVTQLTDPACTNTPKPKNCWPEMPVYLQDLADPGTKPRDVAFSINGNPGVQPNSFYINDVQYDASCANATMVRDSTENWLLKNEPGDKNQTLLPHPFHIHVNPFQVIRNADRAFEPPYVWQDTIALPVPGGPTDQLAGPIWSNEDAKTKCQKACQFDNATWNGQWKTTIQGRMSVCGCQLQNPTVLIRHKFEDYTGGYVLHCHFLGHEDRGMMWNVQTVCDSQNVFGTPVAGQPDDCAKPSSFRPNPLPQCRSASGN
jgi:FtsP/CotA-like multicopper oxidase with cupredoxin domain